MKEVRELTPNNIKEEIEGKLLFLYGAGYTAKICIPELNRYVKVAGIIDDDNMKWGKELHGCVVNSFDYFLNFCDACKHKDEEVNIILTSIYGKSIVNRLQNITNLRIFQMYDWYTDLLNKQEVVVEKTCKGEKLIDYKKNIDNLQKDWADIYSAETLEGIYQYFLSNNLNNIIKVCTEEESYFIQQVVDYFGKREIALVDAGAYEGELLRGIQDSGLNVKEWYCFELDKCNYQRLVDNISKNKIFRGQVNLENKGLWSECIHMQTVGEGAGTKVIESKEGAGAAEMITINEYFKDKKIDMIKMDIEGAEINALKGGMDVIKRDRPVLAISIYHHPEHYYEIPKLLMKELKDYKYYIRQHAMIYGETVLYAIPKGGK